MRNATLRIGDRTEALLLVPATLLLLVGLSLVVLFGYRGTVDQLLEARGREASRLAADIAEALDRGPVTSDRLGRLAPGAWAVAVLDREGVPVVVAGDLAAVPAPYAPAETWWRRWWPPAAEVDVVTGVARLSGPARVDERHAAVRVDLPALVLRAKARSLRILIPLVLVVDMAVVALILVYLRRLVGSFDRLVATARRAADGLERSALERDLERDDDVEALLATFERAVDALARRGRGEPAAGPAPRGEEEPGALVDFQRTLARSLASGVLLLDDAGGVLALNEIGAGLLGIAAPAAGTVDLGSLLAPHPTLRDVLVGAVERRQSVQREELEVVVAEERRTVGLTVHPLRRDDGAVRGFLVLFTDLTAAQRAAARQRLAESLSQVGTLAAGVAHEMRNGMATLRGYLGLIERARDGDGVGAYLHEIRRESDHLERVLDDFLRFARPGTARPSEVDLAALARRCSGDPALGAGKVRWRSPGEGGDQGGGDFRVHADPDLVERALRNLLRNAVEAQARAERSEPVEVEVAGDSGSVEVRIDDRGPGLDATARANLFEPFATTRPGGVGLGLALSHRIALLHDGDLELVARAGGGVRAVFRLPRIGGESVTEGSA